MDMKIWILILAALGAFFVWKRIRSGKLIAAFRARGAVIVDVRSPGEFRGGHASNALNLPLDQLSALASKLDASKPILVCCATGARSAMGARLLRSRGFEAFNAGPWTRLR